MHRLIKGIHEFQSTVFRSKREFFEHLAHGQKPETLMITCSDSRINPNMITQTDPGELLILRNAGNIVPPYGPDLKAGEQATIEFAIEGLGIKDIIVCGHSHCAMKGLLNKNSLEKMPSLKNWLEHSELARMIVEERYQATTLGERLNIATQENVLVQLINLRTHPAVSRALNEDRVKLHGWVYKFETGQVFEYEPESGQFLCVTTMEVGSNRDPEDSESLERFSI